MISVSGAVYVSLLIQNNMTAVIFPLTYCQGMVPPVIATLGELLAAGGEEEVGQNTEIFLSLFTRRDLLLMLFIKRYILSIKRAP